ncbi:serine hydrolase domain-containing protein [Desulfuribacillus alkaliarsenatis]|uniref:Serine hydrolase n=1 Tax=Desulfuribacillus alkaliarsenatis TaxID=766136 RepID=A0A1E5FZM0_9FIRM|nr:serine hydrolase [Desulfuribacillus alkaliarsenatis]OEF95686.1 serine hydrolase [Desulfuribacillus alkaliarsenatis]
MNTEQVIKAIEDSFRKQVQKDDKVQNAYLMVHWEKADIHMNIAEGETRGITANPQQPNYMASVGKIFTATLIAMLHEQGKLSFEDQIIKYIDEDIAKKLHVYKGKDYTDQIKIKHLLNQTSGLFDNFWPLIDQMLENPDFNMSPKEAIIWGRDNLESKDIPGKKLYYTDTNYHLLGLIIERVTGKTFDQALKEYFFQPLDMKHSYVLHTSEPIEKCPYPMADFYFKGNRINDYQGYKGIDYAGGGVVATNEDLLKFMKALATYRLVSKETLDLMKQDKARFGIAIDYGYSIWQFKTIPIIMPKKFNCWGCVGATGAFMFYHPELDAYVIGNFNDVSYMSKGLMFMLKKVINNLTKLKV